MDPSVSGLKVSPSGMTIHRDTADFGAVPGPGQEGPRRARIGRLQAPLLTCRRIGLLLLAVVVLAWLPIFGSADDPTPARRLRGVGQAPILGFELSPDGALIATIQMDRRVALRDAASGLGAVSFLVKGGLAHAHAFSPDGRSLALGRIEPDIVLYDLRAGGRSGSGVDTPGGRSGSLKITRARETWWPFRPMGDCWRQPAWVAPCGCGTSRPARSYATSATGAIGSPAWRSRPTGGCWPRQGTTPTSGSGTWPRS
jgi:hypothetical protein